MYSTNNKYIDIIVTYIHNSIGKAQSKNWLLLESEGLFCSSNLWNVLYIILSNDVASFKYLKQHMQSTGIQQVPT